MRIMSALSCSTMATSQENKSESAPSTNTYNNSRSGAVYANRVVLARWMLEHKLYPYPTKEEKEVLAKQVGITTTQVSWWFANSRRRIKKLGNWLAWEEFQASLFGPCLYQFRAFSTTNNLVTADYGKPNTSAGSLYHPGYPYPHPDSLCGPAGIHGFGTPPPGTDSCMTSPLMPHTPSYSPSFQPFLQCTFITPTPIPDTPLGPLSAAST